MQGSLSGGVASRLSCKRGVSTAKELYPSFTYMIGHLDADIELSGIRLDHTCLKSKFDQIKSV